MPLDFRNPELEQERSIDERTVPDDTDALARPVAAPPAPRTGIPPEDLCPYDISRIDRDMPSVAIAASWCIPSFVYFHPLGLMRPGSAMLEAIKHYVVAGLPVAFSMAIPDTIDDRGFIDYRPAYSRQLGSQSLVAVGFDDAYRGPRLGPLGQPRGAILFRSSWLAFGDNGYGWLPYEFIKQRLATDFWVVLAKDWVEHEEFSHPFLFQKYFT